MEGGGIDLNFQATTIYLNIIKINKVLIDNIRIEGWF